MCMDIKETAWVRGHHPLDKVWTHALINYVIVKLSISVLKDSRPHYYPVGVTFGRHSALEAWRPITVMYFQMLYNARGWLLHTSQNYVNYPVLGTRQEE